jgi:ABC-type transporter MlaC component
MKKNKTEAVDQQYFKEVISCLEKAAREIKVAQQRYKEDKLKLRAKFDELVKQYNDIPAD